MKKAIAALAALLTASALAGVDVNTATQAELESISGIGPAISASILDERRKRAFTDWNDLFRRVQGVGGRSATKFSAGGMTVNGKAYGSAPDVDRATPPLPTKAASGTARATDATTGMTPQSPSPGPDDSRKNSDREQARPQKPAAASAAKK